MPAGEPRLGFRQFAKRVGYPSQRGKIAKAELVGVRADSPNIRRNIREPAIGERFARSCNELRKGHLRNHIFSFVDKSPQGPATAKSSCAPRAIHHEAE